jgi:hypothetical protein
MIIPDDIHRDARAAFDRWWQHTPHLHGDAAAVQAHVHGVALRFAHRLVVASPGLSFEDAREQLIAVLTPHAEERLHLHEEASRRSGRRPRWQVWRRDRH